MSPRRAEARRFALETRRPPDMPGIPAPSLEPIAVCAISILFLLW